MIGRYYKYSSLVTAREFSPQGGLSPQGGSRRLGIGLRTTFVPKLNI